MNDIYNLQRFVTAQAPIYAAVCAELREGRKQSHWMWFIFPQIKGLGSSALAQKYAISSLEEARAYLEHPILGPRLEESTRLVNAVEGRTIHEIFGSPDDLKFHSSMTLFLRASSGGRPFEEALQKYFGGQPDPRTLEKL